MNTKVKFNKKEYLKKLQGLKTMKFKKLGEKLWCNERLDLSYLNPTLDNYQKAIIEESISASFDEFYNALECREELTLWLFQDEEN